jgi:hypothetical protein
MTLFEALAIVLILAGFVFGLMYAFGHGLGLGGAFLGAPLGAAIGFGFYFVFMTFLLIVLRPPSDFDRPPSDTVVYLVVFSIFLFLGMIAFLVIIANK